MTFDEALRALEKKWRGLAEVRLTWERGGAAELEDCADELAALLTTRQEVAPVVGPYVLDEDGELACGAAEEAPAPEKVICPGCCHQFHAISVRDQERLRSTGQTSDARDDRAIRSKAALLFFHKLRETSDVHEADASVGIFDASWHCGSSGLSDALNVALDAAMQATGEGNG